MVAEDKTFTWGKIGLGSFDDTSAWDDLRIQGHVLKTGKSLESDKQSTSKSKDK